jgi:hypothetical protein
MLMGATGRSVLVDEAGDDVGDDDGSNERHLLTIRQFIAVG